MNIYQVLKRMLCFIMVVGLFASCQKDEETSFTLKGDLKITFLNEEQVQQNSRPNICVVGEPNHPLYAGLYFDKNGVINIKGLNFGNYVLDYSLATSNMRQYRTFQIKAGEVTELTIQ